jgi:diguanylate cyclase (GGDEF)-like protein
MTANVDGVPRVLIVEDEAITALDLSAELTGLGYEVCGVVDTADEAVRMAVQTRPALVLMDVRLADGGDGVETARIISSRHDTAIVFLTAHSDESTLARALEVSPFGYLIKPFRARDLKVAIELALAKHSRDSAAVRDLYSLATTDPLTGLANRRHLDATLEAEWGRCRETGRPLAVIMIDIDHFKAFNDAVGHLAGDACLERVASGLRDACRCPGAVLGRWGGEEFLAVLPDTDLAVAVATAERMIQAIRETHLPCATPEAGGFVTVSAGASAAVPDDDGSIQTLLHRADRGLYTAKRAGRDRVGLDSAAELPKS